jgi:membrane protein DedA with SNARE-associated domain
MHDFLSLIAHHGYAVVFAVVLAEAVGLPVPAALALLAAGAAVASGVLSAPALLLVAVVGMLLGDSLLFVLGHHMGWGLLGLLCKMSVNPETCILRSAESFYKRGKITLVIAKFIPGINTMAPPLAGSMKMAPLLFLRLDLAGAVLYAMAYGSLGFLFRDFLVVLTHGFRTAGRAVEIVLLIGLGAYIFYRVWLYRKHSIYRIVPRVQVEELARKLASEDKSNVLLVDVRSHGYYDANAARIQNSIRIEPNNLPEEIKNLSKDKDIYVYCT